MTMIWCLGPGLGIVGQYQTLPIGTTKPCCRYTWFMNTIERVTLLMPANQWKRRLTCTETSDLSNGSKGNNVQILRDPEVPFGWATSGGCSFVKLLRPSLSQTVFEPGTFHRWARWARLEVSEVQFVGWHSEHISTWLTEDISSCIKHHFTYKVCIQLSAFFIFYHHPSISQGCHHSTRLDLRKLIDIKNTSLPVMYLRFKVARLDQPIYSQPHPSICYWWPSWAPQKYEVLSCSAAYRVATRPNNLQGASVACEAAMQGVVLWER